ncbi:MAG: nitroreductase family protein [Pseudomonadota bacterium]
MDFDLGQIDEVLSTARSVRRKLDFDRPIEREVLFDCINVAVQAPTGLGGENWRFLVVDDPAQKQAVATIYKEILLAIMAERNMPLKASHKALIERLHEIPAMLFVCVDGEPDAQNNAGQLGFYGSILPAAWSLMLALRARQIGSTWTSLLSARAAEVAEILGIPQGVTQTVMLPAGYTKGAVLRRAERLPAEQVTYFNRWGTPPAE